MGPDQASYQGKKRNEKSWARYREAMAKKAIAPKPPSAGNTVDSAGRESFVKPGHVGWKIDVGAPSRADGAPKAKAPTTPKKITYGLGKAGISTVVDLGNKPSKETIVAAHRNLRGGKAPKVVNAQPARTPKIKVHAPDPSRPPYVYKQDNKVEFKPINVGENAVKYQKFYGKNPAPLLPRVKTPVDKPKDKSLQNITLGVTAAVGGGAIIKPSKATDDKFGATEAEIEKVAKSGETTAPPTEAQKKANEVALSNAPKDVQDLAKQIEAARAENIRLGGSEAAKQKSAKPSTPTVKDIANMNTTERNALKAEATARVAALEKKLFEATNVGETALTGEKVAVNVAKGIENHENAMARRKQKVNSAYFKKKSQQIEARKAGLDPETMLPKNPNIVLSSIAAEPTTAYEKNAERLGQQRGEKAKETAIVKAQTTKTASTEQAGKVTTKEVVGQSGKTTKPSAFGQTGLPSIKTPVPGPRAEVESKAVKYPTPKPVDINEREHQKLQERLRGDAPSTTDLAKQVQAGEGTRPPTQMSGKMGQAASAVVLEGGIDKVGSGEGPETERAARHSVDQATLAEAQSRADELQKKIAKEEAKSTKSKEKVGRGERTAESFQPGGSTIEEQLSAPENVDVKRIVRVGMEGGGKWDEKPAEFSVEQVIGKELEDLKARARGDRRQETRRSGLAGEIEAEIDKSRDLREGTERRGGPRRGADVIDPADEFLLKQGERDLVNQTRTIERNINLEPEAAERVNKKNALDELRRVAEEARLEAAKTGGESPAKIKTRVDLEAELEARKAAPWFKGDIKAPRPGTGSGMFKLPTVAEDLETAKVSNQLRARRQGAIQGMSVERRAPARKVTLPKEGVEKRVEIRGPQKPPGQAKVPQLSTTDMGQQLSAPAGRPGSQYVEKPTIERRRPKQFDIWTPEGTSSEESTRRVMENYARARAKAQPPLTSPGIGGSTKTKPAKPYTGEGGVKVRKSISSKLVKGGIGLGVGALAFTIPEVASAYMDAPGAQKTKIKKAGGVALEAGVKTAASIGAFSAALHGATKLLPKAAGAIRIAGAATGAAAAGHLAGTFAGDIYSRVRREQRKKVRDIAYAKEKYGTVEAATRTRKGQTADGKQLTLSDADKIMSQWEKGKK